MHYFPLPQKGWSLMLINLSGPMRSFGGTIAPIASSMVMEQVKLDNPEK